ncbi:hypothetical protein RhiirB3_451104 [Rhizophagus irregularis]|nr:hypothetical protein RhiirB3_451104 [Rhizophagus irregularis]
MDQLIGKVYNIKEYKVSSNIEGFKESSTREFEGSGTEEFESSSIYAKESKDDFILKKDLKWIPYNKFKKVEYLNKGGFGTIYKAIWLKNNGDKEVILKCHNNLNKNLNEFLNEV